MIQTQPNTIIDLSSFKLGLNTIPDYDSVTLEQSPNCMDVIFDEGVLARKRYGRAKLNASTTGASDIGYGLFDYGPSTGVKKLIAKFSTTIYKMDDLDGTYDSLATGRIAGNMYCTQSRNHLIICEELNMLPYWWDGVASSATVMNSNAPVSRYPIDWMGYLFLGWTPDEPKRFYYADDTILDSDPWLDYYTIRTSNGDDEFTGWAILRNRLYAFMKNSIHRISYLGGSPLFDINEVITITGAVPRTIQNVSLPNGQEVLIFLNWQKKLCVFDGTYIQIISTLVERDNKQCPVYLDGINRGGIKDCHSVVDRDNSLYHLFIPLLGSVKMTHRLTFNFRTMAMYPSSNQGVHSAVAATDTAGNKYCLISGYTGYTWKMDIGLTDDGTAINEYYVSPKIGAERTTSLKKVKKIVFIFQPISNYELSYYERLNFSHEWTLRSNALKMYSASGTFLGVDFILGVSTLGVSTLGAAMDNVKTAIDIPTTNNLYQYKITSNSATSEPWVLNRIEFIEKELGKGSSYENIR